jgi:hypothetical protein
VIAGLLLLRPPLDFGSQPLLSPLLLQLLLPLFLLLLPLLFLLLLLFLPLQELCIRALARVPQHSRCLRCSSHPMQGPTRRAAGVNPAGTACRLC